MKIILLILLSFINFINCAKILAIFIAPSKSHAILGYELFRELIKSGHEITMISPFGLEMKNPPENFTNLMGVSKEQVEVFEKIKDEFFEEVDVNPMLKIKKMYDMAYFLTNATIFSSNVQTLMKSNTKFDLVMSEVFLNEALMGFSTFFKCPYISLSTVGATTWVNDYTGNPYVLSYIPSPFLTFTDRMNLMERLQNVLFFTVEKLFLHFYHYDKQEEIYNRAFPDPKPSLHYQIKHGVSLVLLNGHFSINFPRPHLPNLVEVGGMHIARNPKPLPSDIKKFLDDAEEGVVYFSLGSNLSPSKMSAASKKAILSVLSQIKQNVLWKWDDETITNNNKFMIKKWCPQDSILAHPNVKLFITHGGFLSLTESIYYGVPILAIPFFGDQQMNANKAVLSGWGLKVGYTNLTDENFKWALNEILTNKKYSETVKLVSERFRDQPDQPIERAKYWIEYVIRHKGAKFMESGAQYLNLIEYNNIDVFLIMITVLLSVTFILFKIIAKIIKVLLKTILFKNTKQKVQ